jgi:hypothetical protein
MVILKDECDAYTNTQPKKPDGSPSGTTPGYYYQLALFLSNPAINDAKDYASELKKQSIQPPKAGSKPVPGQLLEAMNREHKIYFEVDPKFKDYGSKADHVLFHYYTNVLANAGTPTPLEYTSMQKFVNDHANAFPGGMHIKVDTVYEKKGPLSKIETDPTKRKPGTAHHISIVNFGMSKDDAIALINDRTRKQPNSSANWPIHDVKFEIGGVNYGISIKDGKPLVFMKIALDGPNKDRETELTASESSDIDTANGGKTKLVSPTGKKYESVTHAIADSFLQMQQLQLALSPGAAPMLTSNANPSTGTGTGVQFATGQQPNNALSFAPGLSSNQNAVQFGPGDSGIADPSLIVGTPPLGDVTNTSKVPGARVNDQAMMGKRSSDTSKPEVQAYVTDQRGINEARAKLKQDVSDAQTGDKENTESTLRIKMDSPK